MAFTIDELKAFAIKKFADKFETSKNFKFIETKIKMVMELVTKKSEKADSWLLAKKPVPSYSCASCENYLGNLKESTEYVAWNKYPVRENDNWYRLGNGYSKMLQTTDVEFVGDRSVDKSMNMTMGNFFDKKKKVNNEVHGLPKLRSGKARDKSKEDEVKVTFSLENDTGNEPRMLMIN